MLGTSLLWRSTVAFTYLKVKSAKCLCLLQVILVLVLRIWSIVYITVADLRKADDPAKKAPRHYATIVKFPLNS